MLIIQGLIELLGKRKNLLILLTITLLTDIIFGNKCGKVVGIMSSICYLVIF